MAKRKTAKKGGKRISDPSGDDYMKNGKLMDPKHDDRIVKRGAKRKAKRTKKRGRKRMAHR